MLIVNIILVCFLLYQLNTFYFRSEILINAHKIDSILIDEHVLTKGSVLLNFPKDSEMPFNVSAISGFPATLASDVVLHTPRCNSEILILHGDPWNIVFGVRGVNWPPLEDQITKLSQDGIHLKEVWNIEKSSSYYVPGIGMPNISALFKLSKYDFQYGITKVRIDCANKP